MKKAIIKQDILDLDYLIKMYSKEGKFEKASNCLIEKKKLEKELKGEKNEKKNKLV